MKIAAAQIRPVKGDILTNIGRHKRFISFAVSFKANAIFFPELSLTGYEPALAKQLAASENDRRLDGFQEISDENKITIGAGMPTKSNLGILISMIIFQPYKPRLTYSKQKLHPDEFPYFICGDEQTMLTVDDTKIAPAICYESLPVEHCKNAKKKGAEVYMASVAKSQSGVDKALVHYPNIAGKYSMTVLMANCIGYCDNFESVGKTSIWNDKGKLVGQLNGTDEGILIYDTKTREIITKIL